MHPKTRQLQERLAPSRVLKYTPDLFGQRTHLPATFRETLLRLIEDNKQIILYGPPGTGKTFIARELALLIAQGDSTHIRVVQFHPAYTYEDFVIGLVPDLDENGIPRFHPARGAFLALVDEAEKARESRFVMIIDEINRGNLPKILGELMYLLEYRRVGADVDKTNPLSRAKIPHLKDDFSVPDNVLIIGTMNTADRSIGQIDLALRRRFYFVEIAPNKAALAAYIAEHNPPAGAAAKKLFNQINAQLRRDLEIQTDLIGHTFFMHKKLDDQMLRDRLEYAIRPLIEEILYEHPEEVRKGYSYDTLMKKDAEAETLARPDEEAAIVRDGEPATQVEDAPPTATT